MARRLHKTSADYVAIALSPALIMAMVGSLTFFLLEVTYQGRYPGRLTWILGCFVLAIVLIARISMEQGRERGLMFAGPLALATGLALWKFVGLLPLHWAFMGLIWWSANKLTWDCTLIDDDEDASGQGLLQIVGLDPSDGDADQEQDSQDIESKKREQRQERLATAGTTSPASDPAPSNEDRQEDHKSRKKPHAPGVWIIYFSLAALPLFGLGQAFIPSEDLEARRYAFRLLCVYVGSGLGLLLSTSFLGLRRYLRQRRVEMPDEMAASWIVLGTILIVAILAFAALLPRPAAEYAVSEVPFGFESPQRESSRYAIGDEGADRNNPDSRSAASGEPGADEPRPGGEGEGGEESSGGSQGEGAGGEGEGGEGEGGEESSGGSQGEGDGGEGEGGEESSGESNRSAGSQSPSQSPSQSFQAPSLSEIGSWLTVLLKWLFYAVLIALAAWWLWKNWARVVASWRRFWAELQAFWQRLFGAGASPEDKIESRADAPAAPRTFAEFPDPFATGMADRHPEDWVVRYSFEAVEAWARENGCPRHPEQTPYEFARQVGRRKPALADGARELADLYCHVAYAPGKAPSGGVEPLRDFWTRLSGRADRPR